MLGTSVQPQIYCDSVALSKNKTFHEHNKHIDIEYHFVKKAMAENQVKIEKS